MRVAYVSGPYRSHNLRVVIDNIRAAESIAIELWRMGFAVICPHMNTMLFDGTLDMKYTDDGEASHWDGGADIQFIRGDIAIIERLTPHFDCIVMIPGWKNSAGAGLELEAARKRDLLVYYWPTATQDLRLLNETSS